ncbi:SDR family oxidoreductase [Paenibacillus pabuli]|uniref:SDR family oxidoreductase n=1 Tax=Paenibacillus pabuli TaxID=1472 RepID=UPI0007858933|nr:SDR family oxidoreductase [Paenibacillus pabuli]MEC0125613.1 SDR family oxidoreductase [Paenibacillus pabuli]
MQTKKYVFITGANKGIGFETARQLGKMGYVILLGARNELKGEEAARILVNEGIEAHGIMLDVTRQDTIQAAVSQMEQKFGSLDVLINNAGISVGGAALPSQISLEDIRKTYDTNFFGMISVTQALLPLLQQSPAGRIVNLTSGLGSLAFNSDPEHEHAQFNLLAYNSSKAAVNMFTVTLAKEFRDTPLKINSADPGFTATDLNGFTGIGTVQQAAAIVVKLAVLDEDGPTGGFHGNDGELPW